MHAIVKKHSISGLGKLAVIGAFTLVTSGTTALAQAQTPVAPAMPMDHSKMGADKPMPGMKGEMGQMKGMAGMQMTGDPDVDFATMTRSHHVDGVEMAKAELANGKDPVMKKMAQKIIDAQTKEIAAFDRWLATHKAK